MNTNHVIDSWIAELNLAPRGRRRRREAESSAAMPDVAAAHPVRVDHRGQKKGRQPRIPVVIARPAGVS